MTPKLFFKEIIEAIRSSYGRQAEVNFTDVLEGTYTSKGGSGGGDVEGPASATDNAIARFDGTTGKLIQNSGVTVSDVSVVTASGFLGPLNGQVGGTTPAAGSFTSLSSSSTTALNGTTIPASKTLVVTTDKLSALAATTSSELAGVISDETGTGALVFSNSPTLVTPALGTPASGVVTNLTGTASININGTVGATTPNTAVVTTLRSSGNTFLATSNTNTDPVASRTNGLCVTSAAIYMRNGLTMKWGLSGNGDHVIFYSDNGSAAVQGGGINTTGSTTSFNATSDARLKTNVREITNSGSIIDAVHPVLHDWKTGEVNSYGFIAQELHQVFPRAVTPGDTGEEITKAWGVDMSKLIPVIIAEIKSLRSRVAELENMNP